MKRWLDRTLGSLAMYKLVLASLVLLAILAISLAFFGLISPDPLALLASLPVAVVFSFVSSWFGASVVRQRSHLE
jgi:hypothetical protein